MQLLKLLDYIFHSICTILLLVKSVANEMHRTGYLQTVVGPVVIIPH